MSIGGDDMQIALPRRIDSAKIKAAYLREVLAHGANCRSTEDKRHWAIGASAAHQNGGAVNSDATIPLGGYSPSPISGPAFMRTISGFAELRITYAEFLVDSDLLVSPALYYRSTHY